VVLDGRMEREVLRECGKRNEGETVTVRAVVSCRRHRVEPDTGDSVIAGSNRKDAMDTN
jgi:hypothetical protein